MTYSKLLILFACCAYTATQKAYPLNQSQQAAEKIRVDALHEEWNRLQQQLTVLTGESDPVKKVTLLKQDARTLLEKGNMLVEKIKEAPITPESKERLTALIAHNSELSSLKSDWHQLQENLSKIAGEKDTHKRIELMKAEGTRLIEKGKSSAAQIQQTADTVANIFRKK